MKQTLRIRTVTRVVCENRLSTTGGWLPHVMRCIDDTLTGWLSHEVLSAACEAGASEHTLEYILWNTAPVWKETVKAAVRGGYMHVLRWMIERDDGRGPWRADFDFVLGLAATHGHLDVVKWLFERGIDVNALGETRTGYIEKCWLYRHSTADALALAAEHGNFEVVKWIYGARTDTCIRDSRPMSQAIANGHLAIVQWLHSVKAEDCAAGAIDEAAENGHLEVLQWLNSNHLFTCTTTTMDGAAENGHLEVVKWLHQVHHECCFSTDLNGAVDNGNLALAKWLYEHIRCDHTDPFMCLDTTTAASRGHLDMLKWTDEHFPGSLSSDDMDAAASNGHMNVMTWLHENRREGCSDLAVYGAARNGHLEALKLLHTHYPTTFGPAAMDGAAGHGHLEIVRWLHENRPEGCTHLTVNRAASKGHLDILLFLLEHRTERFPSRAMRDVQEIQVLCHFNSDIQASRRPNRATSYQLKMLQTLFEQRPAFVRYCLRRLARGACSRGNIALLDWVNQFGIELKSTEPIRDAVRRGDVKMLQWFFDNGFEITDPDLLEVAVEDDRLEVVRWLSEHGYPVNSLELVKIAGKYMNVPTMRWLVEYGPPLDLSTATILVLENHRIEIAWWVGEKDWGQLVIEALLRNDRDVVWWILVHAQFQVESAQRCIRDAIQRSPKDIQQWFEESMSKVDACRWCLSTSIKRQNEEAGETSSKRRRER
ncbi:hypothetical protein PR001_g13508 [Phytophthora rubi]|uniref:Uncharacterized protein n=1 Tax=Phytophthora rubi TaxID=129364 RepID=A0A6A3LWQ2_9STRA|nr:hypothetical protein PR001_g13508 [Phytophthora rubi]KAE9023819.1 hypothetical protein PR002_g11615 [Phytophthora rubi]